MNRRIPLGDRIHASTMFLAAGLIVAYWVEWFTNGRNRVTDDPAYVTHQETFPLADAYMAVLYLAAARALWKQRESAVALGVAAGAAHVFLGLMDLLYDLQRGTMSETTPEARTEQAIVGASLVFGPLTMIRLWRGRRRLGA